MLASQVQQNDRKRSVATEISACSVRTDVTLKPRSLFLVVIARPICGLRWKSWGSQQWRRAGEVKELHHVIRILIAQGERRHIESILNQPQD